MFEIIREIIERRRIAKRRTLSIKKSKIRDAILKFYEDLQAATGKVDVPPMLLTTYTMHKFVKTDKDINRIYNNLQNSLMYLYQ